MHGFLWFLLIVGLIGIILTPSMLFGYKLKLSRDDFMIRSFLPTTTSFLLAALILIYYYSQDTTGKEFVLKIVVGLSAIGAMAVSLVNTMFAVNRITFAAK